MKEFQGVKIIGIDNGYGNMKTANCCFPAGLTCHDTEPVFKDDLLVYGGRYYLIGTGHKEFAAVASQLREFTGVNMLCDIGNGTMNIMFITDRKPVTGRMYTEKYGTQQCMLAIRENVMRTHHATVDDSIINRVLRFGTADIQADYLATIQNTAKEYVHEIFRILREHEYNPALMRLHVLGGGGCLIRNFGEYDPERVTVSDDICATAKGYEYLCEQAIHRSAQR